MGAGKHHSFSTAAYQNIGSEDVRLALVARASWGQSIVDHFSSPVENMTYESRERLSQDTLWRRHNVLSI